MKNIKFIFFFTLLFFHFLTLYADIVISLGWPYLGVKYNFNKKTGTELRWATSEGINVFAGRGYWYLLSASKLKIFTGFEAGYITFDTLDTKGTGYENALFIGGEYFVLPRFSLAVDFAPTYIYVNSDNVSTNGTEIVANVSVNYYFSSSGR